MPLLAAVYDDNLNEVGELINNGLPVNGRDKDGITPLMLAAASNKLNSLDILKILIEAGAKADLKCKDGSTALSFAAGHGHFEKVKCLIEAGAIVNHPRKKDGNTPLTLVSHMSFNLVSHMSFSEAPKIVAELINAGANINQKNKHGETALMGSVVGNIATMELLIKSGSDVNIRSNNGKTALIYAIEKNNNEAIKLLQQNGSDGS